MLRRPARISSVLRISLALGIASLAALPPLAWAEEFRRKVVGVADGDTISLLYDRRV